MKVSLKENILIIKGSVPGKSGNLLTITNAVKEHLDD
jgi:ribosomal protein L3